jgi:hypothetical protein
MPDSTLMPDPIGGTEETLGMSSTTHALKRPEVIRYLGLAGAVLLATDAYLFGAYATIRTGVSPVSIARGPYGPAVLVLWAAGVAASPLA